MRLNNTEWKVMQVVWRRHPATARDVLNALEDDTSWAYTTVKTIMARLVEKGALAVSKRGNTSVYEPQVERADARRSAVRALLDQAFDGAFAPLLHFIRRGETRAGSPVRRVTQACGPGLFHQPPSRGGRSLQDRPLSRKAPPAHPGSREGPSSRPRGFKRCSRPVAVSRIQMSELSSLISAAIRVSSGERTTLR